MKYALITGTRPQIIKSAPLIWAANDNPSIDIIHIFTGQHYDSFLTDVFFQGLKMGKPEYQLDVGSGSTSYHVRMIIENTISGIAGNLHVSACGIVDVNRC